MQLPGTYSRKGPQKEKKSSGILAGQRFLVGVSERSQLALLAAQLLRAQGAEVELHHVVLGPIARRVCHLPEEADEAHLEKIKEWAASQGIEYEKSDMLRESDAYCQAWLWHQLNQAWCPDILARFQSRFLMAHLFAVAKKKKAFLATGHRGRVSHLESGSSVLLQAREDHVDQSMWLGFLAPSQLKQLYLPLGQLKVDEMKRLFEENKLNFKTKSCKAGFLQDEAIGLRIEHLEDILEIRPLKRVQRKGYTISSGQVVMGQHEGVMRHLVGSDIELSELAPPNNIRTVLGHDMVKNWVIVGKKEQLRRGGCLTTAMSWAHDAPDVSSAKVEYRAFFESIPDRPIRVTAELMADSALQLSRVKAEDNIFEPHLGASVVLYKGTMCLGAGQVVGTLADG